MTQRVKCRQALQTPLDDPTVTKPKQAMPFDIQKSPERG
jgi:hypothetical protein